MIQSFSPVAARVSIIAAYSSSSYSTETLCTVDVSNSELPWVAAVDTAPEQPAAPSAAVSATTAAAAKRRLGEFANERTVRSFEPEVGTFQRKQSHLCLRRTQPLKTL